jgi:LysM repeat protein/membrane protease YdiL (CAAX protease family)
VRWGWSGYLLTLALAELALAFWDPRLGIGLHLLLVVVLTVHAAFGAAADRPLRVALLLVPLVRVTTLAVPVAPDRPIPWFAMTALPMLAGVLAACRVLSFAPSDLGIRARGLPMQLAIAGLGVPMGIAEYVAFEHPATPWPGTAASVALAVAALLISGIVLELTFRGVLQRAATARLGAAGLLYASAAFAILHIPALTVASVPLGFVEGLVLGWMVATTRSIVGASVARGIANLVAVLVLPLLLARWQIGPPSVLPSAPPAALQSAPATPSAAPFAAVTPGAAAPAGAGLATAPAPEQPAPAPTPAAIAASAPASATVVTGAATAPIAGPSTSARATPALMPRPETKIQPVAAAPAVPETAPTAEALPASEPQPSPSPRPAEADPFATYIVQPGDSLYELAQSRGSTVEELAQLNGIANPSLILIGQQLRLPRAQSNP